MTLDLFSEVDKLVNQGKMDQALHLLEPDSSVKADIERSIIFEKQGKFEKALEYADKVISETDLSLEHVHGLVCKTYAEWRLDQIEQAHNVISDGLGKISELEGKDVDEAELIRFKAEFFYLKGILYNVQGELRRPFELFEESYKLRKSINHPTVAHSLNSMGIIKELMGELVEALEYHEEALALKREQGILQDIYRSLNNIGVLYHKLGKFDDALECFKEGLELSKQIGITAEEIQLKENIASLNKKLGQFKIAENLYLDILELNYQDNDVEGIAISYQNLISTYREWDKHIKANDYLEKLSEIYNLYPDNYEIKYIHLLESAKANRLSTRVYTKMQGQRMLRDLIDSLHERENLHKDRLIEIYVEFIRSLLDELQFNYSEEVIIEIHEIIQEIEHLSKLENLILERIESLELLAKLKVIEGNIDDAGKILINAQLLAEEKGFNIRAKHISEEYDRIIIHGVHLDEEIPISEKLQQLHIDDVLSRLVLETKQPDYVISDEAPVQILVFNEAGSTLFSHSFDDDLGANQNLIGSFLSAIHSFGNEIFTTPNTDDFDINRIEHKGYSILMQSVNDKIISYIFKGPSYHALKRLQEFTSRLKNSQFWYDLANQPYRIPKNSDQEIDEFIDKIFPIE